MFSFSFAHPVKLEFCSVTNATMEFLIHARAAQLIDI